VPAAAGAAGVVAGDGGACAAAHPIPARKSAHARTMAERPGRIFTGLKTISELEGGPIVAPRAPGTMSDLT